ncbi:MAG: hypothetical protein IT372_26635, partial [Polyangiaceae bacterium]|nr:hypothetical protein [Polyangiaceae bacterium]
MGRAAISAVLLAALAGGPARLRCYAVLGGAPPTAAATAVAREAGAGAAEAAAFALAAAEVPREGPCAAGARASIVASPR